MQSSNVKGALLGLACFAIFATHDAVIKTLGASISAVQIVFFSVLLSFPLITVLLIRDRVGGSLLPRHPVWVAIRTLGIVVSGLAVFYAFSVIPLAQVHAILFATPLLITILSIPILKERVGPRRWLAVIVGLVGVLVVLRPGQAALEYGHAAALIAATATAVVSIVTRKIGSNERSVVLLIYPLLANFVLMGAALPFVYVPMTIAQLGGLAVIALFSVLAMLFMIAAYRTAEAVVVAPMQYSQMIWAILFGRLFFGERVDAVTLAGAGIIIASGLYIVVREGAGQVSENRPVQASRPRPGAASLTPPAD